jgi:RNA polymerase sigma-70 factor, ECF subfamily
MDVLVEKKLIKAAQGGDEQAMGMLYDANVNRIYRYIQNRVNNSELARDLTSEVFLRMVKDLSTFEYRNVPLIAWLYRIANFCVIDHFRQVDQKANETDIDDLEIVDEDLAAIDSDLVAEYRTKKLREAITKLTVDQQQVIILRFVEGFDIKQTANLLGKSIDSVKVLQYRAVQSLGRALQSVNKDDITPD